MNQIGKKYPDIVRLSRYVIGTVKNWVLGPGSFGSDRPEAVWGGCVTGKLGAGELVLVGRKSALR